MHLSHLRVDVGAVLKEHLYDGLESPGAAEVERRGQVVRLLPAPPARALAPRTVQVAARPKVGIYQL